VLVSLAKYRKLTGESTSSDGDATAELLLSQQAVQEFLRRPIECAVRTETLRVLPPYGIVQPSATPLISVSVPTGLTVDPVSDTLSGTSALTFMGLGIFGLDPTDPYPRSIVTYVGGWLGDDDYSAIVGSADTSHAGLPVKVRRAIAFITMTTFAPASVVPVGVTSVRNGDVSVTYGRAATADFVRESWFESIRGYRRQIGAARQ